MHARRWLFAVALTVAAFASPGLVQAHRGGLDASGGHRDRKLGSYHFHRGPLVGQSFASKYEALAAMNGQQRFIFSSAVPPPPPLTVVPQGERLETLVRLLVKKGIITEAELAGDSATSASELSGESVNVITAPAVPNSQPIPVYAPPSTSTGTVQVRGYYRKDGTYVRPHTRSRPRR